MDLARHLLQGGIMTRYEMLQTLSIDDLAWFIQTIIEETEQNMLSKLAEYGLEVSLVTLDSSIRHAKILADLEADDG
jgi:hypothetical protein